MPVSTRRSTKIMNPAFDFLNVSQASSGKQAFDEASADLTAFLDLSSFGVSAAEPAAPLSISTADADFAAFANAFVAPSAPASAHGALRPVDDALLDSPLGLELTPSSLASSASSFSGSPYDLAGSVADYTSPLMSSYGSPLVETLGGQSLIGDFPSLFAPVPAATASFDVAMSAAPSWNPVDALVPVATSSPPFASPSMEDVKPVISPTLTRLDSAASLLFDFPGTAPNPAPAAPLADIEAAARSLLVDESVVTAAPSPAPSSQSGKRKSVAQLRKEAAALVEEKAFVKDNFKGFRNTKKPMISYDAPTLQKNYLTESATSRKRAASTKPASASPSSSKRARASATPAPVVELPQTAPEPLAAEDLDEEQLSAIELKRRQNTLAARRSRMRKAEFVKSLQDEIERLKQINEELMRENGRLREKCGEL
ncbi:hypothetical protein JCM8547_001315 [Rhodosporidiobolus lusitaniae]